jgi:hypothetical protein
MCTMTLVPRGTGELQMAVNRDESRDRPAALPPVVREFGARQGILPIDPLGGGTWVAVNDAGLAFTLLNRRQPTDRRAAANPRSRGLIIPSLLAADDLDGALRMAGALDLRQFQPFRLLMTDVGRAVEFSSNGEVWEQKQFFDLRGPLMFTSSGLGDQVVDGPRRRLFNEMFGDAPAAEWPRLQDEFQRHSWPERRDLSVCMNRDDARTVSLTTIDIQPGAVTLSYHGLPPDQPAELVTVMLPRRISVPA